MGIRALGVAAVVAVGVGSAADAAGVHYVLQYEDTALENAFFSDNSGVDYHYNLLSIHDTPWRLPTLHPNAAKGDIYKGYALFRKGYVPSCHMGRMSCGVSKWNEEAMVLPYGEITTDDFRVTWDWSSPGIGKIVATYWGEFGGGISIQNKNIMGSADAIVTTFTIVDSYESVSPVPLPASAALLPLGLGALALLRRRRRSA